MYIYRHTTTLLLTHSQVPDSQKAAKAASWSASGSYSPESNDRLPFSSCLRPWHTTDDLNNRGSVLT